jgi:hypothetical protein
MTSSLPGCVLELYQDDLPKSPFWSLSTPRVELLDSGLRAVLKVGFVQR